MMHNLWHIELVLKWALRIARIGHYSVDVDCITAAAYFHGFIETEEAAVHAWLHGEGQTGEQAEKILLAAQESLAHVVPRTPEGKILHDAHLLEGGKAYMVTKCLTTGSLRGQTLPETIAYVEGNILGK